MVCAAGICCYADIIKKILMLFLFLFFIVSVDSFNKCFPSSGIDQVDEMVDDASMLFACLLFNKGNAEGTHSSKIVFDVCFVLCLCRD